MNKCIFTYEGKEYTYDQMRQVLIDNYETLVESPSALKTTASSLREKAAKLRAKRGDVQSQGLSLPDLLDLFADILESADSAIEALKAFKNRSEYKDLTEEERKEFLSEISDIVQDTESPDLSSAESEERISARGQKRLNAKTNPYVQKLVDVSEGYTSVDFNVISSLVDQFFSGTVANMVEEKGLSQAMDEVLVFASEIAGASVTKAMTNDKLSAVEVSFSVAIAKRVLSEIFDKGTSTQLSKYEKLVENFVRQFSTALSASQLGADPLSSLPAYEAEAQREALGVVLESGRTVKDVVAELQDEIANLRRELAAEALKSQEVENVITTVSAPKDPKPRKPKEPKKESERAKLKKERDEYIRRIKTAFSNRGPVGPLMILDDSKKEIAVAFVGLVRVEIKRGYYTVSEIVANLAKDLEGVMSKKSIRGVVEDLWEREGFDALSESERRAEALEQIADAVKEGSSDELLKAVAKAIKIVSGNYSGRKSLRKGLTERAIIEEILKDPESAKALLEGAYGYIENELNAGSEMTSGIKASKPSGYTDEQWEAVKRRFVLSRVRRLIDSVLPMAEQRLEQSEQMKQQEELERLQRVWIAAKERREASKQKQNEKERERLAKEEVKQAEREVEEAERLWKKEQDNKDRFEKAWIAAKERLEERKRKAEAKELEKQQKEEIRKAEREVEEAEKLWQKEQEKKQKFEQAWLDAKDKLEEKKRKAEAKELERLAKEEEAAAEREEKEANEAYTKAVKQAVKNVVKEFYNKPHDYLSLAEAIIQQLPFLEFDEAVNLAQVVERQMEKMSETKDKRRVSALMKELTNGKDEANASRVVIRAMTTRGAMNTHALVNSLSSFLGYKGMPASVIKQVTALMNKISTTPEGPLRQQIIRKVNTIVSQYTENSFRTFFQVLNEITIRNILSPIKLTFTGGVSVFFLSLPYYASRFISMPKRASVATSYVVKNLLKGKYAISATFRQTMIENEIPYGREIPAEQNPYDAERPWLRVHNMRWKEVKKMWNMGLKGRATAYALSKMFMYGNLQGKYLPVANFVNGLQAFLDYVNVVTLRDFEAALSAQRKAEIDAAFTGQPQSWKDMVGGSDQILNMSRRQALKEYRDMVARGEVVPPNYVEKRTLQLATQASDKEIIEKAHHDAVQAIGMGDPETLIGLLLQQAITAPSRILGEASSYFKDYNGGMVAQVLVPIIEAFNYIVSGLSLFARIGVVLAEKGGRYSIPIVAQMINAFPFKWEMKNGQKLPVLKRNEDGTLYLTPVEDKEKYVFRLVASSFVSMGVTLVLNALFDDEEVKDSEGNVVYIDGKPVLYKKYNPYGLGVYIDFYGSGEGEGEVGKVVSPKDVVVIGDTKIPFTMVTPMLYPFFKMMGTMRDEQRTRDIVVRTRTKGDVTTHEYDSPYIFSFKDVIATSAMSAYDTDFSPIGKIIDIVNSNNPLDKITDAMFVQRAKSTINPRIASEFTQQLQNYIGQHKIYVGYNMGLNGDRFAEYFAKNVWFLDPFIQDREKFESVDVFGNPISFPPIYDSIAGLFGRSVNTTMGIHIGKHQRQYNLFKDQNGQFVQKYLDDFQRYLPHETRTDVGVTVKIDPARKRIISDTAYKTFGKIVEANYDALLGLPIENRIKIMKMMYEDAKDIALSQEYPASNVPSGAKMYEEEFEILKRGGSLINRKP